MAKPRRMWGCRACGTQCPKWQGRCDACGAWNTLDEVAASAGAAAAPAAVVERRPVPLPEVVVDRGGEVRLRTGVGELDLVLGGGLVAGSLVLVGGDPGVGKSTLLLMALDSLARRGLPCLYVTGEESLRQVRLRADRLGIAAPISLLAQTDFAQVDALVRELQPVVAVIDSVQTMSWPDAAGIPGSASQIREVAHRAMGLAKGGRTAVVLVGHITKSGELAGPKILEHFVDAVLYFEGDGRSSVRALRATKNRFGAAGEVGLFEMVEDGLREVPDASARLLAERAPAAPGTAVVASIEGSRPMLVEIQALVGRPGLQVPARTCVGVDRTRVQLLAAVLEKAGVGLHDRDLFVNVAGGLVLEETASDLGVICAVASSAADRPIPRDTVVFGEVGLVGEIRGVGQASQRLKEAARHGFRRVVAPASAADDAPAGVEVIGVRTVREALTAVLGGRSADARG